MVRFTDFISLRSSSGLLRKGRKEAVKLAHNLNIELSVKLKELHKQISYASEEGTEKSFLKLLKVYEDMDNEIHQIYKNEILIIDRVQERDIKSERKLNSTFKGFYNILEDKSKQALNNSVENFNDTRKIIEKAFMEIREEARNIRFQRYDYNLKAFSAVASTALTDEVKRVLPTERGAAQKEKSVEEKIQQSLDLINKTFLNYKKKREELEKNGKSKKDNTDQLRKEFSQISKRIFILVNSLEKNTNELKQTVEKEMRIMIKVCKDLYTIRVRIIHMLSGNPSGDDGVKHILIKLKNEGISPEIYNKLYKKYASLMNKIHKNALIEEKMALHEYYVDKQSGDISKSDVKKGK